MTRVLIITGDASEIGWRDPQLSMEHRSRTQPRERSGVNHHELAGEIEAPFTLRRIRPGHNVAFARLEAWADVIIFQGHAMAQFRALRRTKKIVVADIYDPLHLEMLEQGRELGRATWDLRVSMATADLNEQLALADFFLCASERQRLFYLGQLTSLGRLNPATYEHDPHLSRLITVVPFGLTAAPPVHETDVVKGVRPGISATDKLLIWGGGLYNWFDLCHYHRCRSTLRAPRRRSATFSWHAPSRG